MKLFGKLLGKLRKKTPALDQTKKIVSKMITTSAEIADSLGIPKHKVGCMKVKYLATQKLGDFGLNRNYINKCDCGAE